MGQIRSIRLEDGSERLLRWLEHYPFQRAQDLVVALSPWESRTVVYERLAELEQRQLIEVLLPGITRGKRVYHLSPLGTYVCDQLAAPSKQEAVEKRERWERPGSAQVIREEREKLVRLLPRLPVFFLLQDVVNGFLLHASVALAIQGRQASMLQWSWQRDYGHAFTAARDKIYRLRVEGVLTLCLRFAPVDHPFSLLSSGSQSTEESWYTLFLLHCPLDEIRLIRTRLDRLLRWRESAERTAMYSQMPPLLILATTERQAEWWHQAAVQGAARLCVDLPVGALTCLSATSDTLANGWRLSWRRLGTKEPCHVQELLRPWRAPAVPKLLVGRGAASESHRAGGSMPVHERQVALPPRLHMRAYALTGNPVAARKAPARTRQRRTWPRDYRLASVLLTPRHWEILRLIFAHPLLSPEDLALLLALSPTSINVLLADLKRAGYLVGVVTPVGVRWQLAEPGLLLLARLALCHVQRLVHFSLEEAPLQQRGAPGLLHQIHHTAGLYGFFTQLNASLATLPTASLSWWETGVNSERHFRYGEKTYRFRPDALAAVQLGSRYYRFWLEWDRGTMKQKDLRIKFATYAMYLISREWARSSPFLPALLCVTPEVGQEHRLAEAAMYCLRQVPAAFRVYTTTAHRLAIQGILAPIWQEVVLPEQQTPRAPPAGTQRLALFHEGTD